MYMLAWLFRLRDDSRSRVLEWNVRLIVSDDAEIETAHNDGTSQYFPRFRPTERRKKKKKKKKQHNSGKIEWYSFYGENNNKSNGERLARKG